VPWLLALDGVTSWRGALASGLAMALAFSVTVFSWFPLAMADYAGTPVWIAVAIAAVATPLFQPQLVVFPLARHAARASGRGALGVAVAGACAYVAVEWAWPKLLGDSLGLGLHPSRALRQAADLGGVPLLTLVLLLGNSCVHVALRRRTAAPIACLAAIVAALAGYGSWRLATLDVRGDEPPVRAGIVQANVAHYDRLAVEVGTYEAVRTILDAHFALSHELFDRGPLDVVVWPETVYPTTFGAPKSDDGAAFDRAIGGMVAATGTPLVFGSYDAEGGREYNAAVFLEPDGRGGVTFDTYRKATLFPLTERVPAWIDGPRLRAWLPWLGSWHAGAGAPVQTLVLRGGRRIVVAPLICYDAVAPAIAARAVRDGAELLVTLSNDSWLADGAGARLHFLVSIFRSIETRRPQLRATTTGISAVVTSAGDVVETAGVHERTALVGTVAPVRGGAPLAVRWGDWVGPSALVVALALLVWPRPASRA
jgi:apolipoprotein N-acyltransferase